MAKMTPTRRSLDYLRGQGCEVFVVEHWNAFARIRQDLLGFADLLVLKPGEPPLLVQVTTRDHQAHRAAKIVALPSARTWLECGGRIEVHGWAAVGRRGQRKVWDVAVRPITPADFGAQALASPTVLPMTVEMAAN